MGVVRITWRILKFHTPWIISRTAEARIVKFCALAGLCQILALGRLIVPERGVAWSIWSILKFYMPLNFSGVYEHIIAKFSARFGPRSLVTINCLQVGMVKVTWRLYFFGKWMLISRKRCKIKIYLQWKTNRKSYMAYQMAATVVTLNDFKVIHRLHAFQLQSVEHLCNILHEFNWQCARGPSTELPVWMGRLRTRE